MCVYVATSSFRDQTHLDVFIADDDLVGTGNVLQHRNLVVDVGETHQGAQDGLSLHSRRLQKTTASRQFPAPPPPAEAA